MSVRWVALACVLATAGCRAPVLFRRGDQQVVVEAGYGDPIEARALWYDVGVGRAQNWSVTAAYHRYLTPRLALRGGVVPARVFDLAGSTVYAYGVEVGVRWVPLQWKEAGLPMGIFVEGLAGLLHAEREIPPAGDHTNFTQDIGVGFEVALDEKTTFVTGYRMRHLSNGEGSSTPTNPTQNDHHFYLGFGFRW